MSRRGSTIAQAGTLEALVALTGVGAILACLLRESPVAASTVRGEPERR